MSGLRILGYFADLRIRIARTTRVLSALLLSIETSPYHAPEACKNLLRDRVFNNSEVLKLEVRGRQVIRDLMSLFWEGAKDYLETRKAQPLHGLP